jgi:hypothetical protein
MVRTHRQDRTATGAVLRLAVVTQRSLLPGLAVACRAQDRAPEGRAKGSGAEGTA